ncbi:hypothetical protein [Celeribacter baekdonensis]|uniref:hypothetical protein n=1 Tax=Celeribacter baekdonensis TaxID=875171 RepID=UPI0030DB1A6B|tara:strand:- start:219259 stop:220038 length:780 start_codon:yes stop_codon:yes gene_type:complete
MYLAFVDEADHTASNSFTVCGMTAIPVENAHNFCSYINGLRISSSVFEKSDLLKFSTSSKPSKCTAETHLQIKRDVIEGAGKFGAIFIGYCHFNEKHAANDADRNRLYGFNTLLGKFDEFLKTKKSHGIVQIDRLDFARQTKKQYKDGFSYLREKSQLGNKYPNEFRPLNNILSYSMTCEGTSDLTSANDIITGSLRYIINGQNDEVRKTLQEQIKNIMWKSDYGRFQEYGLTMRPFKTNKLKDEVKAEYQILRDFLNS